jgi:hypothetical protein
MSAYKCPHAESLRPIFKVIKAGEKVIFTIKSSI